MHSRVFELCQKKEELGKYDITEDFNSIADYYYEQKSEDVECDYQWLQEQYGCVITDHNKETITFDCEKIMEYYDNALKEYKELVSTLTLEEYVNAYKVCYMQSQMNDEYGFYVLWDYCGYQETIDTFLRDNVCNYLQHNKLEEYRYFTLYKGRTWDYHS